MASFSNGTVTGGQRNALELRHTEVLKLQIREERQVAWSLAHSSTVEANASEIRVDLRRRERGARAPSRDADHAGA